MTAQNSHDRIAYKRAFHAGVMEFLYKKGCGVQRRRKLADVHVVPFQVPRTYVRTTLVRGSTAAPVAREPGQAESD